MIWEHWVFGVILVGNMCFFERVFLGFLWNFKGI